VLIEVRCNINYHLLEIYCYVCQWQNSDNQSAGMLTRPEVSRTRPVSQGQGHRPKAKARNAKVIFPVNAKVNPVFQFRVIFAISSNSNCNKISKYVSQAFYDKYLTTQMLEFNAHKQ